MQKSGDSEISHGDFEICGVAAAVANAMYNATGVRVREYPIALDRLIDELPEVVV